MAHQHLCSRRRSFFHSLCVHKGVANSGTSLRQSIDARYQRYNEPIDSKSFLPHISPVTWEEVYHDWPNENYKYYWHDLNMQLSDYDFSYHQERDRLAFEMADVGDGRTPTGDLARGCLFRLFSLSGSPVVARVSLLTRPRGVFPHFKLQPWRAGHCL